MANDEARSRAGRVGFVAASLVSVALLLYALVLGIGLLTLERPGDPISDPWFTMMELLILVMMPCLVLMSVGVHGLAPPRDRMAALAAVVFAAMLATLTSAVHFAILTLSRAPEFAGLETIFSFRWPSVVYAIDILAWDVFFPLFAGCLAFAIGVPAIRWLLLLSAALSFVGLGGAFTGDMALRNVGIVGYVVVFFPAVVLIAVHARREAICARAAHPSPAPD